MDAQWTPVVETASHGDSSSLLHSSKPLEQQIQQHSQTSVICVSGTVVWVSPFMLAPRTHFY